MKTKVSFLMVVAFLTALFVFPSCKKQENKAQPDTGTVDTTDTSTSNFTPSISITPSKGEVGRILTINMGQSGFDSTINSYNVKFDNSAVRVIGNSVNKLKIQVPQNTNPGIYKVTVSGSGDSIKVSTHFEVVPYNTIGEHHVLLFGIDGLQFNKIAPLNTPNLDSLYTTKAFTGGIKGTGIEQPTISGPGWMTILNGVWLDKHGVPGNCTSCYEDQSKSVFTYIKENKSALSTAAVVDWRAIFKFLDPQMTHVDDKWSVVWNTPTGAEDDVNSVEKAASLIINKGPHFIFDYVGNVDETGHLEGYGQAYNNAIEAADKQLGTLLRAIKMRKTTHSENWLVIVTTDHGRSISSGGSEHGGQTKSEKTIFIGMNKQGNVYFNTKNTDIPNKAFDGLYGYPAQTSVTPTVLRFLGIDIKSDWAFGSSPLIGESGARNLMFQGTDHNQLYWKSNSSANAIIYKNGKKIGEIPASQGGFTDNTDDQQYVENDELITYTVDINGVASYISTEAEPSQDIHVSAIMPWQSDSKRIYIFRNDEKYTRFNTETFSITYTDEDYPLSNDETWPNLAKYGQDMTAILLMGKTAYVFLTDGTYVEYDEDSFNATSPQPVNDQNWPGLGGYGKQITAAANWYDGYSYIFLKDGTYLKYDNSSDKIVGEPLPVDNQNWPGLESYGEEVTAVYVNATNTQYAYFFLGDNTFIKYDIQANKALDGYPKPIDNTTWPKVL